MRTIVFVALALSVWAAPASDLASGKGEVAVGETLSFALPCNATTGYRWEVQSIDSEVAVPTGPIEETPPKPGTLGGGGRCVFTVKGVKPGRARALLEYRRPWEKGKPARTFTAKIRVLRKKP